MGHMWFLVLSLFLFNVQGQDDGLTIQTAEGPVTGTLVLPNVRQFLGIPYATVARWQAPQPAAVRDTTFEATQFGDSCVQELSTSNKEFLTLVGLGAQNVQESEDCLSLNVWAPSTDRSQTTAVMLWLYGGGFEFGTSNTVYYDGQNIVGNNNDVLVVSINYRTNIFGFPGAPQLSGSSTQNFGALDVDAAIQWVHDNIASFGGDPERIVLFGESAGSGMIAQYTFANPTDTKVKGVIQQSGSLAGLTSDLTAFGGPLDTSVWNAVAEAVGCGTDTTDVQLNCMKGVDFRTLENAVISTGGGFVPVQDGITFFSDVTDRSSQGNFLRVPLLVGNNNQEGDIFVVGIEETGLGVDLPAGINKFGGDIVTKVVFSCPAGTTAADRVKAGVPTWRYRYDGIFSDISTREDLRAYHSAELPILFGTSSNSPFGPPTADQNALTQFMQGAWVAFARDPQNGLINFGFPPYDPNTNSLVIIGGTSNITGASFTSGSSYDSGCTLSEVGGSLALKLINALGGIF